MKIKGLYVIDREIEGEWLAEEKVWVWQKGMGKAE